MRNKEVYKIGFDPATTEDPKLQAVFKSKVARVLWLSIKSGHLTDQNFNDRILAAAERVGDPYHVKSYDDFLRAVNLHGEFGKVNVSSNGSDHRPDHEFWADVYQACCQGRMCKFEVVL